MATSRAGKNFLINCFHTDLKRRCQEAADKDKRSLSAEIQALLEEALKERERMAGE
jgi:hypothetical protein